MTLPKTIDKDVGTTSDQGEFTVKGEVSQKFIVELKADICWLPFREVYDVSKFKGGVADLVIYTEKISDCE